MRIDMTNFNINQFTALAKAALAQQENGQEFLLSDVYNMSLKAYEQFPEDPIIRQFAFVIEQKAERMPGHSLISQAEMTRVFNDINGLGDTSRFRSVLGAFLKTQMPKTANTNSDFINQNRVDAVEGNLDTSDYMDSELVNALHGVFGNPSSEQKSYNTSAAQKGADFLKLELEGMGFKPRVEILDGNSDALVYAAHLDTQKGIVSVAVPLDISEGKVLLPSTFVADTKLESLTANNLKYFIDKKAYLNDFSMPNASSVLKAVGILMNRDVTASRDEFNSILTKISETGSDMHMSVPSLLSDKELADPKPYIDATPEAEMPKELAHLAHDFENSVLEAASQFGKASVNAGKQVLANELAVAGLKNAQIRYASEDDSRIVYSASFYTPYGPTEINVPVEMAKLSSGYRPLSPTIFKCNGETHNFDSVSLQVFANKQKTHGSMVSSDAHRYMTANELKSEIIRYAGVGDYQSCEILLGTAQERFGEDTYRNLVADYHNSLMVKHAHASKPAHRCSREIKAGKVSIEARCGCFGVPMSKVVVGSDGKCRLKTAIEREKLNPIEDGGAAISSTKLFWT